MKHDELRRTLVVVLGLSVLAVVGTSTPLASGFSDQPTEIGGPFAQQYDGEPNPNSSEYAKLWSKDPENLRGSSSSRKLAVSDITWSRPPDLAAQWNDAVLQKVTTSSITTYGVGNISDTSRSINGSNTSRWSVAPTDASMKQGTVIRDAYVEVHSISPSIRYHTSGDTTSVTRPSGTVRVLSDLGVKTDNRSISVQQVSVDNVTVTDGTDGEQLARTTDASTGGISLQYEGFDPGHQGLQVTANLSVTYSGANASGTTNETITVTDQVNMLSYSPTQANGTTNSYPNGTTSLDINAGTPFWSTINMSGNRTVQNVWEYYTVSGPGREIVARNGTDTARQGTARAAQVHAYAARQSPSFQSENGSVKASSTNEEAPSLGGNVHVEGPEAGESVQFASEVKINVKGETPDSVSVGSAISDGEDRDVSVSQGENDYKKADLKVSVLNENSEEGTRTVLVNLTDSKTGDGIDTLGTGSGGNLTIGGKTVETNGTGMATVEVSQNASINPAYNPGDRPGEERYLPEGGESGSVTITTPGDGVGFGDLFAWVVDFSPAIVPFLMAAFLFDRIGLIQSWPPWELIR